MIYFNSAYVLKMPEYLKQVSRMMMTAEGRLVAGEEDVRLLAESLRALLEMVKIKNSTAHLRLSRTGEDAGSILLYAKENSENPVARLCYNRLHGALEFDSSIGRFIYLTVLQENIFTKGNR